MTIPVGWPEAKLEVRLLMTFRLAVAVKVPALTMLPRLIPTGAPPPVVLSPLIAFEVTLAVLELPLFASLATIPVMVPLLLLSVLIVFDEMVAAVIAGGVAAPPLARMPVMELVEAAFPDDRFVIVLPLIVYDPLLT